MSELHSVQSAEDMALDFKQKIEKLLSESGKKKVLIPLLEFEEHFSFKINQEHWNWLPYRFKKALWDVNVKTFKARGKDYAEVWIE